MLYNSGQKMTVVACNIEICGYQLSDNDREINLRNAHIELYVPLASYLNQKLTNNAMAQKATHDRVSNHCGAGRCDNM